MLVDLAYASPFILFFGWLGWQGRQALRDEKKAAYRAQFCPTCRAEFTSQAWQDDLSAPYRQRIVKKRYCPNGHSWAVATSSVAGQESAMDRLGGWLP